MGDYADMSWDPEDPDSWTESRVLGRTYGRMRRSRGKICTICHATQLRWGRTYTEDEYMDELGWQLEEPDGTRHVCKMNKFGKSTR